MARLAGVVISERIALVGNCSNGVLLDEEEGTHIANWTFPSLRPPMAREAKYEANVVDFIHLSVALDSA